MMFIKASVPETVENYYIVTDYSAGNRERYHCFRGGVGSAVRRLEIAFDESKDLALIVIAGKGYRIFRVKKESYSSNEAVLV